MKMYLVWLKSTAVVIIFLMTKLDHAIVLMPASVNPWDNTDSNLIGQVAI